MGIRPGSLGQDSPGLGVAIKIADGDYARRARSLVSLTVLRLLNVLTPAAYTELIQDKATVRNNRGQIIGELRPRVDLMQGVLQNS